MTQLAEKYKPSIILYGATSLGRDFAPRVMVSLKTGLTADAIDLGYDEDNVFYQTTPAYGGSILAHIVILECRPQMATVRPKMFVPLEADESRKGEIITEDKLTFKRPGTGISPSAIQSVVGKTALTDIEDDTILTSDLFE